MIGIEGEKLGDWFIYGSEKGYDYSLVGVGREALRLSDVVDTLDPEQSLDWGGHYFGPPLLKERIIATQAYQTVRPDEVFLTNGTYEANYAAMLGTVDAGDEVIVEEPSWTQIRLLARSLGATVKILPLRPENGWKPDPDELRGLLSPRTKLVYLNHPNNPTGSAALGCGDGRHRRVVARAWGVSPVRRDLSRARVGWAAVGDRDRPLRARDRHEQPDQDAWALWPSPGLAGHA